MVPHIQPAPEPERRITALDGVRGLMTILVVVSHYFGELVHGITALMFGWIGVDMFFVLSGFLIGKLILEKQHHANFFAVFYVRRCCRIIPAYILTVLVLYGLVQTITAPWGDADVQFPLLAYLTFSQGFFMVAHHSIGAHWLAPTWTLGVEEHFYLIVPALIVFTPRRWLGRILLASVVLTVGLRGLLYYSALGNETAALVLLPGRADTLALGLLAALAVKAPGIAWARLMPWLRGAPIVCLVATSLIKLSSDALFGVFAPLLVGAGCAAFLLCIVHGAPEAKRFESKALRFVGNNGYCLYLTHLPVLGLMHGLILGTRPDLVTPAQWLVTFAALPVCGIIGWGMTKLIEEPLTRYGRGWRWSTQPRAGRGFAAAPG